MAELKANISTNAPEVTKSITDLVTALRGLQTQLSSTTAATQQTTQSESVLSKTFGVLGSMASFVGNALLSIGKATLSAIGFVSKLVTTFGLLAVGISGALTAIFLLSKAFRSSFAQTLQGTLLYKVLAGVMDLVGGAFERVGNLVAAGARQLATWLFVVGKGNKAAIAAATGLLQVSFSAQNATKFFSEAAKTGKAAGVDISKIVPGETVSRLTNLGSIFQSAQTQFSEFSRGLREGKAPAELQKLSTAFGETFQALLKKIPVEKMGTVTSALTTKVQQNFEKLNDYIKRGELGLTFENIVSETQSALSSLSTSLKQGVSPAIESITLDFDQFQQAAKNASEGELNFRNQIAQHAREMRKANASNTEVRQELNKLKDGFKEVSKSAEEGATEFTSIGKVTGTIKKGIEGLSDSAQTLGQFAINTILVGAFSLLDKVAKKFLNTAAQLTVAAHQQELAERGLAYSLAKGVATQKISSAEAAKYGNLLSKISSTYGLSREAALRATDTLTKFGDTSILSAANIEQLLKKAASLSLLLYGTPESLDQVLMSISAGSLGAARQFRKFGIELDQNALIARGYLGASKDLNKAYSLEQLAAARLNSLLNAQGAWTETVTLESDTFAGSLRKVAIAQDQVNQQIGKGLETGLKPYAAVLRVVSQVMSSFGERAGETVGIVAGGVISFVRITASTLKWGAVLSTVMLLMSNFGKITKVTGTLVSSLLGKVGINAEKMSGTMKGALAEFFKIPQGVQKMRDPILTLLFGFIGLIQRIFGTMWSMIKGAPSFIFSTLKSILRFTWEVGFKTLGGWIATLIKIIVIALVSVEKKTKALTTIIVAIFKGFLIPLVKFTIGIISSTLGIIWTLLQPVIGIVEKVFLGIAIVVAQTVKAILTSFRWLLQAVHAVFGGEELQNMINEISEQENNLNDVTWKAIAALRGENKEIDKTAETFAYLAEQERQQIELQHKLMLKQKEYEMGLYDIAAVLTESATEYFKLQKTATSSLSDIINQESNLNGKILSNKEAEEKRKEATDAMAEAYAKAIKELDRYIEIQGIISSAVLSTMKITYGSITQVEEANEKYYVAGQILNTYAKQFHALEKAQSIFNSLTDRSTRTTDGYNAIIKKLNSELQFAIQTNAEDVKILTQVLELLTQARDLTIDFTRVQVEAQQATKDSSLALEHWLEPMTDANTATLEAQKAVEQFTTTNKRFRLESTMSMQMLADYIKWFLDAKNGVKLSKEEYEGLIDLLNKVTTARVAEKKATMDSSLAIYEESNAIQDSNFALEHWYTGMTDANKATLEATRSIEQLRLKYNVIGIDATKSLKEQRIALLEYLNTLDPYTQAERYQATIDAINKATEAMVAQQKESWDFLFEGMHSAISDLGNTFSTYLTARVNRDVEGMKNAIASLKDVWNKVIIDMITSRATKSLEKLFDTLLESILGYKTPKEAIKGVGLTGVLGGLGPIISKAIGLQEGGIVRRPTLALVGEGGPEAVVPLAQMRGRALSSSTEITVINAVGKPEDFVAAGIAAKPNVVINPVLQNMRMGGPMRRVVRS